MSFILRFFVNNWSEIVERLLTPYSSFINYAKCSECNLTNFYSDPKLNLIGLSDKPYKSLWVFSKLYADDIINELNGSTFKFTGVIEDGIYKLKLEDSDCIKKLVKRASEYFKEQINFSSEILVTYLNTENKLDSELILSPNKVEVEIT